MTFKQPALVLVSRREGTRTWRVRNDRFFATSNVEAKDGHLADQKRNAEREMTRWQAAEPAYQFRIVETEYHRLGSSHSYLDGMNA